jgi:hypothetical protein
MSRAAQERVRLRLEIFDADPAVRSQNAGCHRPHLGVDPA